MDPSRLLFLIFTLMSPSECSEPAELQCVESDKETFVLLEGEAFYIMPYDLTETYYPDEEFTWYKNDSRISNNESMNVHYHGGALYFLNVSAEDSGFYHARRNYSSGKCSNHYVIIKAVDDINQALYVGIENSHRSQQIYCPNTVTVICEEFKGEFSWMKDFKLLQGQNKDLLWIEDVTEEDAGIYTCTCTWEHNQRVYKSSGSRRFTPEPIHGHSTPVIISPAEKEIFAVEGYGITLTCTVFCGTNIELDCHARWEPVNGTAFGERDGYHVNTSVVYKERKNTYATAVLTIDRVSSKDLQTEFKCIGKGFYKEAVRGLKLNRREPAELQCVESDKETFVLLEGEAFYIMPYDLTETYYPDEEFTWYKNDSRISNNESMNVHYHGGALYFLNVSAEDSGFYHARRNYSSGKCSNHYVIIKAVDDINQALYVGVENSHGSLQIYCPNTVTVICEEFKGEFSWMKDFKLLQGQNEDLLWIENKTEEDSGIYTCTCTWEHNQRVYKSSGSRRFTPEPIHGHSTPVIISPAKEEIFAVEGYGITLNCTVLCGTDVELDCHARWEPVNGPDFEKRHGYHVNTSVVYKERKNTYATAVLTIDRVSSKDLQTEFKCIGKGFYKEAVRGLKLNRRVSIVALAIRGASMLFFAVLCIALVKCFTVDLTLCFRCYCPRRS